MVNGRLTTLELYHMAPWDLTDEQETQLHNAWTDYMVEGGTGFHGDFEEWLAE